MTNENEMNINKYNAFMGTIMICIVYAAISLSILLFSYFTDVGRKLFTDSLKYFIITFVFGTIIIIIIMTLLVIEWKPEKRTDHVKEIQGIMTCPDYWKNEKVSTDTINKKNDNLTYNDKNTKFNLLDSKKPVDNGFFESSQIIQNSDLYKNKCVNDNEIVNNTLITDINPIKNNNNWTTEDYSLLFPNGKLKEPNEQKTFLKTMLQMSANEDGITKVTNTTPLKCNEVYYDVLDKLDAQDFVDNNFQGKSNKYRCEFSKICGVPWTSAGC